MASMLNAVQFVRKRSGQQVPFDETEIHERIRSLCELEPKLTNVKWRKIATMTRRGAVNGIKTEELDELSTSNAAALTSRDPEYGIVASRIAISNLHKMTPGKFSECVEKQYRHLQPKSETHCPLISDLHYEMIMRNADKYDAMIVDERDFERDYFSYKTLEKSYLKRVGSLICDRPSYMYLRVAIAIHEENFEMVKKTYDLISQGFYTHATPTLYNACTRHQQMASCFLLVNQEDSILGLYNTLLQMANISKMAGGIGVAYQDVRASDSYIRGTHGKSKGPIFFAKLVNDTARAVDQGGNKRNGAISITNEPWHANVIDFLKMKSVGGDENQRCRDLFPAMWIPDLFFQRVKEKGPWSLFCPNEAPGLSNVYGEAFDELYKKYESTPDLARETISARSLYKRMVDTMVETGLYMLSKCSVNRKSNQKNLGVIKTSNLCTEIMQYSSPEEISVCTLASIALPKFILDEYDALTGTRRTNVVDRIDHQNLYEVVRLITRNQDIIIDKNHYPPTGDSQLALEVPDEILEEVEDIKKVQDFLRKMMNDPKKYLKPINLAEKSSKTHRPIGIGVQGLADVFVILKIAWGTKEALMIDREIFETMYFAAMTESVQLAKEKGPYKSYEGSPISKGIYQFHMWNDKPSNDRWDWAKLEEDRKLYGVRNSLLIAPMPTKSTSHILGNNECTEPFHSMIYKARVLAGEFDMVNRHLIRILKEMGKWNKQMRQKILDNRGSVQDIEGFPEELKPIFRTVWEIPMKHVIDMAASRAPFIDQSQSMNLFLPKADTDKIASMIMYAWEKGLKTLCYYLHIRNPAPSLAYTASPELLMQKLKEEQETREKLIQEKREADENGRYVVTSTLDEEGILNVNVNPLHMSSSFATNGEPEKENNDEEQCYDITKQTSHLDPVIGNANCEKRRTVDNERNDSYIPSREEEEEEDLQHIQKKQKKATGNDEEEEELDLVCPYEPGNPNKKV